MLVGRFYRTVELVRTRIDNLARVLPTLLCNKCLFAFDQHESNGHSPDLELTNRLLRVGNC